LKSSKTDLAPVPLSNPDLIEEDAAAVAAVLRSDRLSIGPIVEQFEDAVAKKAACKYGIAVNSGTSGLHLCVRAMGIQEGDEVITTPFSFVATTNCLLFERATPVFVDIDDTYNMNPDLIEAAITPRTKALLPVEVFGNTAHFDAYKSIAKKHNLLLLEDCCEALGASLGGKPAGSFGEAGVFAFYPNKQITTGEGGLIVTNSEEIRDLCRSMRNQGRDTTAWLLHARLGYNYRLSEINAMLGLRQMSRIDEIIEKRRRAAGFYNEALAGIRGIHLPPMAEPETASWFVYVIRLADAYTATQRDSVMDFLRRNLIGCNPYFVPIHTQPYVQSLLGTKEGDFPVTERMSARTMALPFFGNITQQQVQRVADVLEEALDTLR